MTDGPVEHDLELTVSALKDGVLDLGIQGGLVEIRRWEGQLAASGAPALVEIGAALAELRARLGAPGAAARAADLALGLVS